MRSATTRFDPFGPWLVRAVLAGAVSACLSSAEAAPQASQPANATWEFSIPAGELEAALDRFATQTGLQLAYLPEVVAGKRSVALSGRLTWRDALSRLLQGSGLEFRQVNDTAVVIQRPAPKSSPGANAAAPAVNSDTQRDEAKVTDIGAVTVTGTRIRGGVTPSPVITIGQERIQQEGFSDLGEVIRSVPQNFRGGQNPGVTAGATLGAGGGANQNITGGSSLNLRGLGPDASLTLLNGRRLSYSGFSQAVDISAIPVAAVERVEIVADGASAIYGSDAVGGVGNVILKPDFEGVTVGARYGGSADGGLDTRDYSVTAGAAWVSGGFIATYKATSIDPVYSQQRSYTDWMTVPTTIYPGSKVRSGLVSGHQAIGEVVEVRLDALRTAREQQSYYVWGGINRLSPEITTTLVAPSVSLSLPGDWSITGGATWGRDEHIQYQTRKNLGTGVTSVLFHGCYCNESRAYEVGAEGPLFALRGGDARMAVGAGHRTNRYRQPSYLTGATDARGDESARYAYAELSLPWIAADSNVPGMQRLEFTAAVRGEDYDSFGRVATPKLGLIYDPNPNISLKASWGKSFKAPTLLQRYYNRVVILDRPANYGGGEYPADASVLLTGGGNKDLAPERARTWTTSLALHPEALPGLELELSWFDIDYTDRVIEPITDYAAALTNPHYAEFITYSPNAGVVAAVLADARTFYNVTGAPFEPGKVVALINGHNVNANRQHAKGIDLSGSYRFELGEGSLTLRGAGSWIDITQRTAGTPEAYAITGMVYNPARFNGRIGAVLDRRGFTAAAFTNSTSGVTNTLDGKKTASFTTIDATLRYSTGDRDNAWSGLEFALAAQNLFNRAPPRHAALSLGTRQVPPYDSTNYSAIGRFLSFSVEKHW